MVGSHGYVHLAEHAGTAGTLFASIFVVSMTDEDMVPLRVFGILSISS